MKSAEPSKAWTLQHLEVLLLAGTLLATVTISALTLHQTTRNFEIERTTAFVARFNSLDLVSLREDVDRWLEIKESPAHLYDTSEGKPDTTNSVVLPSQLDREAALKTISKLRTMANFFQEFGTALKIESLEEKYAYELLGGVSIRYGKALEPFILETRIRRQRPTSYAEVFLLKERMEKLDVLKKYN